MPKIRCKVARISQTPRQTDDGDPAFTTHVKLTPINLPAGDIQLAFNKADVTFHPGQIIPQKGDAPKVMIHPDTLITSATVYIKGEKACTFRAADPGDKGHDGVPGIPGTAVAKREHVEEAVYDIDFTEVGFVETK